MHGPASQQIHSTAPELSRARTRQDEARRRRFLQDGVDNREQFGDPLDLVDHHRRLPGRACQQFPKALGTGAQIAMQRRFEQVQIQGIGEPVAQPCGFAGSARTEQEAALVRNLEKSTYEFHYGSQNGNWNSDFRPKRDRRSIATRDARGRSLAERRPNLPLSHHFAVGVCREQTPVRTLLHSGTAVPKAAIHVALNFRTITSLGLRHASGRPDSESCPGLCLHLRRIHVIALPFRKGRRHRNAAGSAPQRNHGDGMRTLVVRRQTGLRCSYPAPRVA